MPLMVRMWRLSTRDSTCSKSCTNCQPMIGNLLRATTERPCIFIRDIKTFTNHSFVTNISCIEFIIDYNAYIYNLKKKKFNQVPSQLHHSVPTATAPSVSKQLN